MSNQEKLLGNQNNLKHLTEAACRGKLSHAYIIAGADGSGKKTFAEIIARTLLCNENPDFRRSEPCGHCSACAKTSSGNHPDLIWVTHEKPRLISVGEVREQIVGPMKIIPYYGPKKIFIVPDAHLMNENAQNALLKTIEEPPEYGLIFLLVNNADYLLDTIRSRCLRLDMELLGTETVLSELTKRGCDRNIALKAAAIGAGNLGTALDYVKGGKTFVLSETVKETLSNIKRLNAADIYDQASEWGKKYSSELLQMMRMWFRDVLVYKSTGDDRSAFFYGCQAVKAMAENISFEGLNSIIQDLADGEDRLRANVKAEAVFENILLRIRKHG